MEGIIVVNSFEEPGSIYLCGVRVTMERKEQNLSIR
jgi:hypothetical protein